MFLSDRELKYAIRCGRLIVNPEVEVGPTSIDLRLDRIEEARIWDTHLLAQHHLEHGLVGLELRVGQINYGKISTKYLRQPPEDPNAAVFRRARQVIIKPGGFLLWQTKEVVGTPKEEADLMCFIDGKSTRARTGLVVHLTAPTIHAGWSGQITLEIANLGPLHLVLEEDDVIAQITVAQITSIPQISMERAGSKTIGQRSVVGRPDPG